MANVIKGGGGFKSPSKKPTAGGAFRGQESKDYGKHVSNLAHTAMGDGLAPTAYQSMLQASNAAQGGGAGAGGGGYGGGGRGGYGGYGGGGGGGGYVDRYAELRKTLESQLNQQRDAARGALPGYLDQFNSSINQIGADNQALTGQYSNQIQALMRQLQGQAQGAVSALGGDLQAQGAGLGGFNAQANQALLGINNVATAQDMYNQRLAQMMSQSQADRLAAGATVNQASNAQLDNAYLQALMQIQGMR